MRYLIFFLVTLYLVLCLIIFQTWKVREQEVFARHSKVLRSTYSTTIHLYRTYAQTVYEEVINKPEILELIDKSYTATSDKQAVFRGRLFRLLDPAYTRLVTRGLRQLHFQFPDNTSFLRFHRLEKYGDDLTSIRTSIRQTNAYHLPVFGFENGRIFCGFRNVFPLSFENRHIGSVEVSVSFKAIAKSMRDASPKHQFLFIQEKDIVFAKAFPSEKRIYVDSEIFPGYIVEDLRILGLDTDDPFPPMARLLNPLLAENKEIQKKMQQEVDFITAVQNQGSHYLITGLAISNIAGQQVAYILSYEEEDEVDNMWIAFKYIISLLACLFIVMGFLVHRQLKANRQLRANESRLRAITQYMGDALYVTDAEGRITFTNHAMEEILGYPQKTLLGKDAHELFHRHQGDDKARTYPECKQLQANMAGRYFENREDVFLRKDGNLISVDVRGTPLRMEHGQRGSVVLFQDISQRIEIELEQAKVKKLESIGILAGGIAHDFNNLLAGIMGNIDLARIMIRDNSEVEQLLGEAVIAVKRAGKLTNQLLTFSDGGAPITESVLPEDWLCPLIRSILVDISSDAVQCSCSVAADVQPIRIDQEQMRLALKNILNNAVQAMDGQGTVTVDCRNHHISDDRLAPAPGSYVRINIRDTGKGIKRQHLERVFDPYFTTRKRGADKGSGLGLSIVHSIIHKHSGTLEVQSSRDSGTTISLFFPVLVKERGQGDGAAVSKEADLQSGNSILLMDDDTALLEVVSKMLGKLDYTVFCSKNGEEAIALYRRAMDEGKPFSAVILDLSVDCGMGGKQTMEELLIIDPQVTAFVSSGYSTDPVMAHFKEYGFKGRIPKPFAMERIAETLGRVLSKPQ